MQNLIDQCDEADFKLKTSLFAVILVRRYSSNVVVRARQEDARAFEKF
jgi:hypothetical protein